MFTALIGVCFMADVTGKPVNSCFLNYENPRKYFRTHEDCREYADKREFELKWSLGEDNFNPAVVMIACVNPDEKT